MSRLSKNFKFSVLSFLRLLGSSDILVIINFLFMTTSIKKGHPTSIFPGPYVEKLTTYVVNFLLRFKQTNLSNFSIHKIGETNTVLTKFWLEIGASPLWTDVLTYHSNCHLSLP